MNYLSSIKERLRNLGTSEFQELCDSFLSLRNRGYKAYSRTGAHDIKQKTKKGTPDSFIQMPSGLYLFVESTTMEHKEKGLLNKLKNDITGCLDISNTGISVNKIQEIILCYNSNLKAAEIEYVNEDAVEKMDKLPTHYGLDRLSNEIFFHHKNLAHDYLGLPLDTGQVVSLDKFVEEYDNGKQKLATPLAGTFLHRGKELENIKNKLVENDIVIISGPAGVGKSKLALESISQFIRYHLDYNAYAISPKGADLIGDLGAYFIGKDDNNILLVDDVNRVDKFEQILGFYRSLDRGKLKLILTVRDYALKNVKEWLSAYKSSIEEIKGFSSEEIKGIIEQEPFGVRNGKYQHKICTIAKGNARLAVMMAIIARKTNKLESLNNTADLFEQYFETFVSDENTFKDKQVLKALGIISFFYTLPYNDSKLLDSISNSFSISSNDLREAFDKLHNLDLIELNYQYVRIGEQNLSTYFFYKVFIKEQLLSFETLWINYFEQQEHRFRDTLYPIYQNFNQELVLKKIKPVLYHYWLAIQSNEDKAFRFLNFAWKFLPDESLAYLEIQISNCIPSKATELKTKYETNDFVSVNSQEKHLYLLANFFKKTAFFSDSLELAFQFAKQNPQHLAQLVYHIDQNFTFIDEDYINHFERQATLIDYLIEELEKGDLQRLAFFAISKKLLNRFHWTYKNENEAEKDDQNISRAKECRGKILNILCNIYNEHPEEVFEIIIAFSLSQRKDNKYVLAFDLEYLIPWIDDNMVRANFHHCYYVQEIIRFSKRIKYSHVDFKRLKLAFAHPTYSLFELIDWDRRRGKDDYDFEKYNEFEELKNADIAKKLTFNSKNEVEQFIIRYREIIKWNQISLHSQHKALYTIIKTNLLANTEIGFAVFVELARLEDENTFSSSVNPSVFIPNAAIDILVTTTNLFERFWMIIESEGLRKIWKFKTLTSLSAESITKEHLLRLYTTLGEVKTNFQIQLEGLSRYEKINPKILSEVLGITVERIEKEDLKIWLHEEFFIHLSNSSHDLALLKKAYLQQNKLRNHFDYHGEVFLAILKRDHSFLLEFIKDIFENNRRERAVDHKELTVVWKLPNVEEILDEVIEYMASTENHYYFSEHFANAFFQRFHSQEKRVDGYLLRLIKKYSDQPKIIRIVFDIIHHKRESLFEDAFKNYILRNQSIKCFQEINWTETQSVYSGDAIIGEIRAAKWERLLSLVNETGLGVKTRAVRSYIKRNKNYWLQYAENEKRRKFLSSF